LRRQAGDKLFVTLKKIAYILIIVSLNTYICSYLSVKLSARMELRRGYRETRIGGIGFPFIRLMSYIGRDSSTSIWAFMTFIFSLLIWGMVPFTGEIALVDMDLDLIAALLFLLITVILNIACMSRTRYGIIWGQVSKKILYVITLIIPFLISIASLVMVSKTLSLTETVDLQRDHWNAVYQPLGLIISIISVVLIYRVIGLSREGRLGLSAIDRSEGMGLTGAISVFSRYSVVMFMTFLITLLYLGGYKNLLVVRGEIMLGIKFYVLFIFILFASKALGSNISDANIFMRISGKFLIPLSIINFAITLGFFIYRNIYGLA